MTPIEFIDFELAPGTEFRHEIAEDFSRQANRRTRRAAWPFCHEYPARARAGLFGLSIRKFRSTLNNKGNIAQ